MNDFAAELRRAAQQLLPPGAFLRRDRGEALYVSDAPGHGVDFNEAAAKNYPPKEGPTRWTEMRWTDGGLHTP